MFFKKVLRFTFVFVFRQNGHPSKTPLQKFIAVNKQKVGTPVMLSDATLQNPSEVWSEIADFPGYSVSSWGRVLNDSTGYYLKITKNSRGLAIVGLMKNAIQSKRSLAVLVATAFVPRPSESRDVFDTPINLDGDRFNNHYSNLVWRPLWFARKYGKQFDDTNPAFRFPVEDVENGEVYINSRHASVVNGVLDKEVYLSMINNTYVWPTGQVFREADDRQIP